MTQAQECEIEKCVRATAELDMVGDLTLVIDSERNIKVPIGELSRVQIQGPNEVKLELIEGDPNAQKDSLCGITLFIPNSSTDFVREDSSPAQVFQERILSLSNASNVGEELAVVEFQRIKILSPNGHYNVQLHESFLRLKQLGHNYEFLIPYNHVAHIFQLDQSSQNNTSSFLVISLTRPFSKGSTKHQHIVFQFESNDVARKKLSLTEEIMLTKYQGKLKPFYKNKIVMVFSNILEGLSDIIVTRCGSFLSESGKYMVNSIFKSKNGMLYPLEDSFLFLPWPPTHVLYGEIKYVVFKKHDVGTSRMRFFDFIIRLKINKEYQFLSIECAEHANLFYFVQNKGLAIANIEGALPIHLRNEDASRTPENEPDH